MTGTLLATHRLDDLFVHEIQFVSPLPGDPVYRRFQGNWYGIVVACDDTYATVLWSLLSVDDREPGYVFAPYVPLQVTPSSAIFLKRSC